MGKNVPDFQGLAQADTEQGQEALMQQNYANRPTQYSPYGYTNWTSSQVIDPSTGKPVTEWSQTTGLTPELQSILDKQIAIQGGRSDIAGMLTGQLGSLYQKPMDWKNLPPMGSVPTSQFTAAEPTQSELSYQGLNEISNPGVSRNINTTGLNSVNNSSIQRRIKSDDVSRVGNPYETRMRAEDAMYNQAMSRLDPQFESQRQGLETRMRNQGLRPEDAAWKSQVEGLGRNQTDARNQAIWGATEAGRAEAGQMFGQQMSRRQQGFGEKQAEQAAYNASGQQQFGQNMSRRQQGFGERQAQQDAYNASGQQLYDQSLGARQQYGSEIEKQGAFYNMAADQRFNQGYNANAQNYGQSMQGQQFANLIRQQMITEMQQQRMQPLNEINAMMNGQQVGMPSMPNFSQSGVNTPQSQTQAGVADASAQNANSPWSSLAGLAGQGIGAYAAIASDRRLKKNIKRIGTVKGHPWYSYDYIWGESSQGVMADEVPEFAIKMPNGYMAVDYGRLLGE